jgi:SAM-dependent methyltransferase
MDPRGAEPYALFYDDSTPDWPGEIDFYRSLAAQVLARGGAILEIACGTGRVALRLVQEGVRLTGLDHSAAMLEVARRRSRGMPFVRWVQGDMRSFELGERFDLALMPGHPFQVLLTPDDQVACLECTRRHLVPGGLLVVHLDHLNVGWLGDLVRGKGGALEKAEEFVHPETGRTVRTSRAWSYEPCTQTASSLTVWEEIEADGRVVHRWERGPIRLHCVFRFEMEHLLARTGFQVEALYGNFDRQELRDESTEMIWVVRNPA